MVPRVRTTSVRDVVLLNLESVAIIKLETEQGETISVALSPAVEQHLARQLNAHFARRYHDDWENLTACE